MTSPGKTYAAERHLGHLISARHEHVRAGQRRRVILREFLGEKPTGSDVAGTEKVVRAAGSPPPTAADHAKVVCTHRQ